MNRCAIASREHCRPQPKVKIFYERKSKKKEQKPKRRVPVTASIAWPTSIREMDERSKIRWQHRLKREHPTGTERRSLLEECGWKGGDSGLLGERANLCPTKKQKNSLDSDRPSHGRRLRLTENPIWVVSVRGMLRRQSRETASRCLCAQNRKTTPPTATCSRIGFEVLNSQYAVASQVSGDLQLHFGTHFSSTGIQPTQICARVSHSG